LVNNIYILIEMILQGIQEQTRITYNNTVFTTSASAEILPQTGEPTCVPYS